MADADAERSAAEIRGLIRKIHPEKSNHKERVRRFHKFRTYVLKKPEFYDDDVPVLLMGSHAADPDDDDLANYYGLMEACGTLSGEHDGRLKRSARHAMNLLKWLILDFKEDINQGKKMNVFGTAFLSMPVHYYHRMGLDLHCSGDDRGGAKEDACQLMVLILTKHLSEDGETEQPVMLEDLMTNPKAQQEFEIWSASHVSASQQDKIAKNAALRQAELNLHERQTALAAVENDESVESEDGPEEPSDHDDVMVVLKKRQKAIIKELKQAETRGEVATRVSVAVRWEDTQLAREQAARAASAAKAGQHETVRDSQEAMQELAEREEEKAKAFSHDPLGITQDEEFDLRQLEKEQAERIEQILNELDEDARKAESSGNEELLRKIMVQKESLESMVDQLGGIDAMENSKVRAHSILPTSPKFHPILFLTLAHRTTAYDELIRSLERLSTKTSTQVEQLEKLVRDNFPLFVRCAEGFEEFQRNAETEVGRGVKDRIDKLEAIAESCTFQARKSFKPLLDNTTLTRQVQNSMAVLLRVAPILQVPTVMRQHLENRRYSEALKSFRQVLVIDESCRIELLKHVRSQAEDCIRDARRDLEVRLAQESVSLGDLLDGIRDLGELLELNVTDVMSDNAERGVFQVGDTSINVRDHPPALACLLLQSAHFSTGVNKVIADAEDSSSRIFAGESLSQIKADSSATPDGKTSKGATGNQWKYDVLDARVLSTFKAIEMIRSWLPRLVKIGLTAKDDEKRRAARASVQGRRTSLGLSQVQLSAFEVFLSNVAPAVYRLVEHVNFCALGSNARSAGGKDVVMTFGHNADDKLRALLRSPLPPSQSTKVGKELAELVQVLTHNASTVISLRPESEVTLSRVAPMEDSKALGEQAVITTEKRRCMYAFDVCARACSNRAAGSGKFDADSLLNTLSKLSEQLSRPDECSAEVEKGCEVVIRSCCEGLASYVRDRGDAARLNAVAECAEVMTSKVSEIIHEASFLTPKTEALEAIMMEDIMGLESAMFDEYLENIRIHVAGSVKIGWIDIESNTSNGEPASPPNPTFPTYLSASLLAIVRCRAQIEQSLGSKVRKTSEAQYQHLAMTTVGDAVIEGLCSEIMKKKMKLKVRQADRLANELEFLRNTLKRFLSGGAMTALEDTLNLVSAKAGRGRDFQLDALEELERLGRVYVLCLGE